MSHQHEEHPPGGPVATLARGLALAGGAVLVAAALLATVSVLLRWATSQPIRGDFELVSIGAGLAVMGFLAHGTLMRANILVDSFTLWLPPRLRAWIDAFWMLVWAGCCALLAERMVVGAMETLASGTRTMGLLALPYWWAIGLGALCFAATGLVGLTWTLRLLRARS
jgi:TRAP-type C4-dicarboxylate transport system permease small subunit